MSLLEAGICLEEALAAFDFGGEVAGALRYGKGHINDTFAVYTQQPTGAAKRFILQRINTHVFRDVNALMQNICGVTEYLRDMICDAGGNPDRETLTVLPTRNGKPYHQTPDGGCWRCYLFIEDTLCLQVATTLQLFAATGRAYGRFSRQLAGYPAHTLHETIPKFHDTRQRYQNLMAAVQANAFGRAAECARELAFVGERREQCGLLMDLLEKGELPLRVTHNDTKLNNILVDPATGEGVCVVDLDTVMPGLILNDFGDSIRSGATTAAEDERNIENIHFSLPLFATYTKGFLQAAGSTLTPLEIELLPWGARLMTLECGIRFLTDYLEGDIYFRTSRAGHNLHRARAQFKLLESMEQAADDMQREVAHASGSQ